MLDFDDGDDGDGLQALYQELILDHNARPHNFGELAAATHRAEGKNPLCGDHVAVMLRVDGDGRIAAVRFAGRGCAISRASASLMTVQLQGKTVADAEALFGRFHALVVGADAAAPAAGSADLGDDPDPNNLGKLRAFAGVREFPMRVKCATLAWHTLRAALAGEAQVSTE